jgi:hypothetical protein
VISAVPPTSKPRRDIALWPLALIPVVGGLAIGGVIFAASLVNLPGGNSFLDGSNSLQFGRPPLAPIKVPRAACPCLNPVHVLAVALDRQWAAAFGGGDRWPTFKKELAAELPALELDVARAEPHVPGQIAARFEALEGDLRLGVAELPSAKSVSDVLAPPGSRTPPLADGVGALVDASDLVGNACGYPLAPSNLLAP